ncbi:hypothetical protein V498_07649, partial [Pseudogymnoascus sp. VKM F-4517 (FW-2822)]
GGRGEGAEGAERLERLGSLFSEGNEAARQSEEVSPAAEFGFQGRLGGAKGGRSVSRGEKRVRDAEIESDRLGAEDYNPESGVQLQPHPRIIGGRRPGSSGLKHPREDDGELYGASPPRATKVPKLEHPGDMRTVAAEARENTENRLILHKAPSGGLAQSLSGGLFLSSDEEVDDGSRDVPLTEGEGGFEYF